MNNNHKYIVVLNQWALIKYFGYLNVDLKVLQKLKLHHITMLFFLVDVCTTKTLIKKDFNGTTYTYLSTNFIVNNLPMLFFRGPNINDSKDYNRLNRTVQNYLKVLKDLKIIKVNVLNQNKRYVIVDASLLKFCNKGKDKLTPLDFMNKYFEKQLKQLRKKYNSQLPAGLYSKKITTFFNNEYDNQTIQKNYFIDENLIYRLESYLKESVKDPYYINHRNYINE